MSRLDKKVAIVTGAGSIGPGLGNGKATAILFAREGAKVFLVDKTLEAVEETHELIRKEHGEATTYQADLRQENNSQELVKRCIEIYGRIDILHNNVGIASSITNVVETSAEEWDRIFAADLKTMIFCSKAVIPIMKQQGGGSIINISSYAGIRHTPMLAYATIKAAVIHLTKLRAVDHGPDNIRVNCIAPGYIDTPMTTKTANPEIRKQRAKAAPLNRLGKAWDVAWAAVYLASDESSFVSGAVLPIDGGRSCRGHSVYPGHSL